VKDYFFAHVAEAVGKDTLKKAGADGGIDSWLKAHFARLHRGDYAASGVFPQITADEAADLAVPGHGASFSDIKAAQSRGDFDMLAERGRRALRVHLKGDVEAGLQVLDDTVNCALA
jgi:hypothetical protein